MNKRKIILAAVLMLAIALGINGAAHALPCDYGFVTGDQSGESYNCENATFDSSAEFNAGSGFYGVNNWVLLEKVETPGGVEDGAFDLGLVVDPDEGEATEGTWSFTNSPWGLYSDVMIVLKGATYVSAYDVIQDDVSGAWDIGKDKPALSHMSVYGGGTPIPEPATMMLLGTGLVGVGFFRKKFKS